MAGLGSVTLNLGANTKDFRTKMQKATKTFTRFGKQMQNTGKMLSMGLTAPLAAFGALAVSSFDKQAKAEGGLLIALKGRKDIQERLISQAKELQTKSLYGDEEIMKAQQMLASMGLEEEEIKKLIPLVMDFATAKGMNLTAASDLVAKSMGSSTNALSRYGIQVDGAVGSNERLDQMLNGLRKQFEGQSEAAAAVGTGPLTQLKNILGDLAEEFGEIIMNYLRPFIAKLKELTLTFQSLSPEMKDKIVRFAAIAAAIGPVLLVFGKLMTIIPMIGKAMVAFTGPVGIIVGALALAAVMIVKHWGSISAYFTTGDGSKMFTMIKDVVVSSMKTIQKVVAAAGQFIAEVWAVIGPFVQKIVANVFKNIGTIIQTAANIILKILNVFSMIVAGDWDELWNGIKTTFKSLFHSIVKFLIKGLTKIMKGMSELLKAFGANKLADRVETTRQSMVGFADGLGAIPNQTTKVAKSAGEVDEKLKDLNKGLEKTTTETLNLDGVIDNLSTTIDDNSEKVDKNAEANAKAAAAFEKNMKLVDETKINMDDMNKEYDVNAEKQKLIQAEVQRLTGIYGANSKEVKALRNRYKEFEVQGASAFDIINNKAEVFGQMGKEFDSVKEKMSILESQITSMIDAGIDPADANLKKLIDTYKELSKQGGSTTDKLSEGLEKFANVAGQIMGQVGAIFAQHHEMKMQTLENERAAQEEDLISDFETQKEAIENAVMTQQEKDLALEELEKSHNDNMEGISQTYEAKMNAEKKKQAQKEKKLAIADAVISTASAVAQALPNVWLAGAIGALGLIQIGLIQSTPIPAMAEGGIVTGPTTALIGEAGAEAVIPLDKMAGMMGSQTVNVIGKISGDDIVLVSDRAKQNRTRIRGINS